MDSSAITKLEQTAVQAASVDALNHADVPLVALPDNVQLHSLEPYQDSRFRFRGTMRTNSIDDFVRYVNDRSTGSSNPPANFVDSEYMSSTVFFNIGTAQSPGHCDDLAILKLDRTAPFRAVLEVDGSQMTQKAIAEWLEDWRFNLTAVDRDGEDMDIKKAVAAVRNTTVEEKRTEDHTASDFGSSRSAMEQIEARSKNGSLPRSFCFACEPYQGLQMREFHVRLSLITGGDAPRFTLRIIKLEAIEEEMAKEFRELLTGHFGDGSVTTYIGGFRP